MRSPRMCSTNFQGPVPTGCRSAASSPTVSMYFLEWMKAEEANNPWVTLLPKATKGFSKRKVMVYGSLISMLLIRRNSGASPLADPSLAIEAMVNLISSAVIAPWLSWNCTPLRREKRQARPPSNTSQRSASMGETAPVWGSRLSKFSIMGLSTTSSAPGYRCGNQRSLPKVATATVSVPSGRSVGVVCAEETASGHMHATRLNTTNHGRQTIALPPLHLTCHDGVDSEPAGLLTAPATPFRSSDGVYRQTCTL